MKQKPIPKPALTTSSEKAFAKHLLKRVCLKITQPNEKSVALVGTFTNWEARPIPLAVN
jgi:hypothetical protein